jgi:sporulation protein YlmC with PRC-barrel domain
MLMMKAFLTAVSVIALMAVAALAQDTTIPKTTTMAPAPSEQPKLAVTAPGAVAGEISANSLLNMSVKNSADESIGDINDLRIDTNGKIVSVIVGVGGFLGLGEEDVALPFNEFSFGRDAGGNVVVTAKVTKESLQSAPEWKNPEDR